MNDPGRCRHLEKDLAPVMPHKKISDITPITLSTMGESNWWKCERDYRKNTDDDNANAPQAYLLQRLIAKNSFVHAGVLCVSPKANRRSSRPRQSNLRNRGASL